MVMPAALIYAGLKMHLLAPIKPQHKNRLEECVCARCCVTPQSLLCGYWPESMPLYCAYAHYSVQGLHGCCLAQVLTQAFRLSSQLENALHVRSIAILLLCYQGSMALGGAFWGVIAQHSDALISITLAAAGLLLVSGWIVKSEIATA